MLVLGVAVALSFRWFNLWEQLPNQPFREPRWKVVSLFLEEAIGKTSFALIPLMLYRRARLGGICRPGELFLVVCAACVLCDMVERIYLVGRTSDDAIVEAEGGYWVVLVVVGTAVVVAIFSSIFLGGRLSDRSRSLLLVMVVAGSYPWPKAILNGIKLRLLYGLGVGDDSIWDYSSFVAFFAVGNVIPAIIGVAALSDTIGGRLRGEAMSVIGLVLGVVDLVVCLSLYLPGYYTSAFPPWDDRLFYVLLAAPAAAGLLGTCIFLALADRWRDWFRFSKPHEEVSASRRGDIPSDA